jgi:hypothetical protein
MEIGEHGEWLWNPERVEPGAAVLGPTYRLMMLDTAIDGTRVFVDCADGSRLCRHGELASTISTWNLLEQAARREGRKPPPRPSVCDCTSSMGLYKAKKGVPPAIEEASSPPKSLFEHLRAAKTPSILVGGCQAQQMPFTSGEQAAFLRQDGRVICKHGRLRSSLLRMKQAGRHARCECMPKSFPHRVLALGSKWSTRRTPPLAKRVLTAANDNGPTERRSCPSESN